MTSYSASTRTVSSFEQRLLLLLGLLLQVGFVLLVGGILNLDVLEDLGVEEGVSLIVLLEVADHVADGENVDLLVEVALVVVELALRDRVRLLYPALRYVLQYAPARQPLRKEKIQRAGEAIACGT